MDACGWSRRLASRPMATMETGSPSTVGSPTLWVGGDGSRRIWAILGNGFRIGACAEGTWTLYDPDHGWHQGYASGLVTDRQGRLWTVAGAIVRRFDPQTQAWIAVAMVDEVFGSMSNDWEPVRFLTGIEIDSRQRVDWELHPRRHRHQRLHCLIYAWPHTASIVDGGLAVIA